MSRPLMENDVARTAAGRIAELLIYDTSEDIVKLPPRPSGRALAFSVVLTSALLGAGAYAVTAGGEGTQPGTSSEVAGPLVGSWELLSFSARTADGRDLLPLGEEAGGRLTYTADGHVSVALWRAGRQPFAAKDQQQGTAQEYAATVQNYLQYVGTFSVDAAAGTVSALVDQSVFPNWNGTTQLRYYKFEENNDRLLLTSPPIPFAGTTIVASLVAERV